MAWLFDVVCALVFGQLLALNDSFYYFEKGLIEYLGLVVGSFLYAYVAGLILNTAVLIVFADTLGELTFRRKASLSFDPIVRLYSFGRYTARFMLGASKKIDRLFLRDERDIEFPINKNVLGTVFIVFMAISLLFSLDLKHLRYTNPVKRDDSIDVTFYQRSRLDAKKQSVVSQRFEFKNFIEKSFSQNWEIYPRIENVRKKKSTYINGNVTFISKHIDNGIINFEKELQIDWAKLLLRSQSHFDQRFLEDLKSPGDHFLLSSREVLSDTLNAIMQAGKGKLSVVRSYGDSLKYSEFRDQFLKILPIREVSHYSQHKIGDHVFVFIKGMHKESKRFIFFPLTQKKANVYSLSWTNSLKQKEVGFFLSRFFKNIRWGFNETIIESPSDDKSSAFHFIDSIVKTNQSVQSQKQLEDYLLITTNNIFKSLKLKGHESNLNHFKNEIDKVNKLVKLKKKEFGPSFIANWNTSIQKIENFKQENI